MGGSGWLWKVVGELKVSARFWESVRVSWRFPGEFQGRSTLLKSSGKLWKGLGSSGRFW